MSDQPGKITEPLSKNDFRKYILGMISEQPMSPEDFRMKMSELITFNSADLEVTGHGRKRWETNLQNSINDLKSEGLIAHLGKNQYVSPIPNSNPLNPEEFWNDFSQMPRF